VGSFGGDVFIALINAVSFANILAVVTGVGMRLQVRCLRTWGSTSSSCGLRLNARVQSSREPPQPVSEYWRSCWLWQLTSDSMLRCSSDWRCRSAASGTSRL